MEIPFIYSRVFFEVFFLPAIKPFLDTLMHDSRHFQRRAELPHPILNQINFQFVQAPLNIGEFFINMLEGKLIHSALFRVSANDICYLPLMMFPPHRPQYPQLRRRRNVMRPILLYLLQDRLQEAGFSALHKVIMRSAHSIDIN